MVVSTGVSSRRGSQVVGSSGSEDRPCIYLIWLMLFSFCVNKTSGGSIFKLLDSM